MHTSTLSPSIHSGQVYRKAQQSYRDAFENDNYDGFSKGATFSDTVKRSYSRLKVSFMVFEESKFFIDFSLSGLCKNGCS